MVSLERLSLLYYLLTSPEVPDTSTSGRLSDVPVTPHKQDEQETPTNTGDLHVQAASQGMPACSNFCSSLLTKLAHLDAINLAGPQAVSYTVSLPGKAATQSQITNIQQNSLVSTGPASESGYRTRSTTQSLPAAKTRYSPLAPAPKTTRMLQGSPAQASATGSPVKHGRGRGRPPKHLLPAALQIPPPNPTTTSSQANLTLVATNTTVSSQANYRQNTQPLPAAGYISTAIQATTPPSSSVSSLPITVAPYPQATPLTALQPSVQLSPTTTSMPVQDFFRFQPTTPMQLSLVNELQAIYEARFPTFSAFHPDAQVIIAPLATWYPYTYTSPVGPDVMGAQPAYGHPPFPLNTYLGRDLKYGPGIPSMTITGGPPMPCFQPSAADNRTDYGFGPGIEIADEFKALAEKYVREQRREVMKADKAVLEMSRMK